MSFFAFFDARDEQFVYKLYYEFLECLSFILYNFYLIVIFILFCFILYNSNERSIEEEASTIQLFYVCAFLHASLHFIIFFLFFF